MQIPGEGSSNTDELITDDVYVLARGNDTVMGTTGGNTGCWESRKT